MVRRRAKVLTRIRSHLAQLGTPIASSSLHSPKAKVQLDEIIQLSRGSRKHALQGCVREIEFLFGEIAHWEERIEALGAQVQSVQIIAKHAPGIGQTLAAMIVGEAGEIKRFHHPKAFARYAGLTPSDRSSGGKALHGGITRQGSPYLRWALTQATIGCMRARRGAGLAAGDWIRAKQKHLGIKSKGRVAGARKIAETIWRIFHYGECFDPAKPFGGKTNS